MFVRINRDPPVGLLFTRSDIYCKLPSLKAPRDFPLHQKYKTYSVCGYTPPRIIPTACSRHWTTIQPKSKQSYSRTQPLWGFEGCVFLSKLEWSSRKTFQNYPERSVQSEFAVTKFTKLKKMLSPSFYNCTSVILCTVPWNERDVWQQCTGRESANGVGSAVQVSRLWMSPAAKSEACLSLTTATTTAVPN